MRGWQKKKLKGKPKRVKSLSELGGYLKLQLQKQLEYLSHIRKETKKAKRMPVRLNSKDAETIKGDKTSLFKNGSHVQIRTQMWQHKYTVATKQATEEFEALIA